MDLLEAREEYQKARRLAQKEVRELRSQGKETEPAVLDEILGNYYTATTQELGVVNIPARRIVGTKTAGRISAFSPGFMPLLDEETEFAGESAVVSEEIAPGKPGKIIFHGSVWQAESDTCCAPGKTVKIVCRKNLTFTVKE